MKQRAGTMFGEQEGRWRDDSMMLDWLEDAYMPGTAMGMFAQDAARDHQFAREAQDASALESLSRAHAHEPAKFTTAPVPAIRKLLAKAAWGVEDVDPFRLTRRSRRRQ